MINKLMILLSFATFAVCQVYGSASLQDLLPDLKDSETAPEENVSTLPLISETALEATIDPETYIVGPGDEFAMNLISSDGVFTYSLLISPTGDVLIPAIGTVSVDHLKLKQAIELIRQSCLKKYANASVYLTLIAIRQFKVLVIGTLESPGFVTVTPLTRVSDIFDNLGDNIDRELLSSRNIKLLRDNDVYPVDLMKYKMFGDTMQNPQVQMGDIIEIGMKTEEVGIFGGVLLPGTYEFVKNESLESLIKLAGGFTPNADPGKIEITRFVNDTDKVILNISTADAFAGTILAPEDHIVVRLKRDYKRQDLVTVEGEVKFPGRYSIDVGKTTIREIINRAGGFSSRADQSKITVNNEYISALIDPEIERIQLIPYEDLSDAEKSYLKARSRVKKGKISSASEDFTRILMEFPLQREDVVSIPALQEYVEVLGAVLHPGRFPLVPGYTYNDYVSQAGGVTSTATRKKYIIKNSTGQRIPLRQDVRIDNGDVIFIAEKLEYNKWERFKDIMAIGGQMAAIIIVIQTAILR
ncbi:MAG: hypothetical protein GXO91_08635 [FCB group bacterium]|nr:hypothetical protein [FCB group bacterium]